MVKMFIIKLYQEKNEYEYDADYFVNKTPHTVISSQNLKDINNILQ